MKELKSKLLCILLFLGWGSAAFAQEVLDKKSNYCHCRNNIEAFQKQDSVDHPRTGGVLLIGSSSFTFWKDVQDYFPDHNIINRGFGGSTLVDLIYAYRDIVPLYKPKQIIIYCGENDLAFDKDLSSEEVLIRFKILYSMIRTDFSDQVMVSYVSMKPSPERAHLMKRCEEANLLIKKFISQKPHANYIDLYNDMIDSNGVPNADLFLTDRLHNNPAGYAISKKIMEPFLVNTSIH